MLVVLSSFTIKIGHSLLEKYHCRTCFFLFGKSLSFSIGLMLSTFLRISAASKNIGSEMHEVLDSVDYLNLF